MPCTCKNYRTIGHVCESQCSISPIWAPEISVREGKKSLSDFSLSSLRREGTAVRAYGRRATIPGRLCAARKSLECGVFCRKFPAGCLRPPAPLTIPVSMHAHILHVCSAPVPNLQFFSSRNWYLVEKHLIAYKLVRDESSLSELWKSRLFVEKVLIPCYNTCIRVI